jgi:hypothetical protein
VKHNHPPSEITIAYGDDSLALGLLRQTVFDCKMHLSLTARKISLPKFGTAVLVPDSKSRPFSHPKRYDIPMEFTCIQWQDNYCLKLQSL